MAKRTLIERDGGRPTRLSNPPSLLVIQVPSSDLSTFTFFPFSFCQSISTHYTGVQFPSCEPLCYTFNPAETDHSHPQRGAAVDRAKQNELRGSSNAKTEFELVGTNIIELVFDWQPAAGADTKNKKSTRTSKSKNTR